MGNACCGSRGGGTTLEDQYSKTTHYKKLTIGVTLDDELKYFLYNGWRMDNPMYLNKSVAFKNKQYVTYF